MPLEPVTWAVLLAKWTEWAKSALALPEGGSGGSWRASVAPAIGLQAVTFALGEAARLDEGERALGIDRAEVLIRRYAKELREAWGLEPMPESLLELVEDAGQAVEGARWVGCLWVVDSDRLEMPGLRAWALSMVEAGFGGDVLAAAEGTVLFRGSPAVFVRPGLGGREGPGIAQLTRQQEFAPGMQVYRQVDEGGAAVRDVVSPLARTMPPGRPLLVPLIEGGEVVGGGEGAGVEVWRNTQRRALGGRTLPVVWGAESAPEGA